MSFVLVKDSLGQSASRLLEGVIHIPRVGPWHADLVADRQDLLGLNKGVQIVFEDAGITFAGTTIRSAVFADFVRMRVVAGAGAFYKTTATPKAYSGVPLKIPVTDLLNTAGEQLSPSVDQGMVNTVLQKWTTARQGAVAALTSLLKPFAAAWRFLRDGSLWFGNEGWPTADGTFDYIYVDQRSDVGRVEIAAEVPALAPGTTFRGRQLSYVRHHFGARQFRSVAYFES